MWRVELDDYGIESCAWKMEVPSAKKERVVVSCAMCSVPPAPGPPRPRPPPPGRRRPLDESRHAEGVENGVSAAGVGRGCCRLSVAQQPYSAPDGPAAAQSPVGDGPLQLDPERRAARQFLRPAACGEKVIPVCCSERTSERTTMWRRCEVEDVLCVPHHADLFEGRRSEQSLDSFLALVH